MLDIVCWAGVLAERWRWWRRGLGGQALGLNWDPTGPAQHILEDWAQPLCGMSVAGRRGRGKGEGLH